MIPMTACPREHRTIHQVPKPKRTPKRAPKPMQRTRMRRVGKRGAAFPKRKHPAFRRWIRTQPCLLRGKVIGRRITLHDLSLGLAWRGYSHGCWGPIDPAHVGQKQSQGAPDLGVIVPLCRAAHSFYDEHRASWARVTGFTEAKMASAAGGYALRYVERGGSPTPEGRAA